MHSPRKVANPSETRAVAAPVPLPAYTFDGEVDRQHLQVLLLNSRYRLSRELATAVACAAFGEVRQ